MLLMNRPRRLSTDIDIIVEPGTDLDAFIKEASKIFPFQSAEEQKRIGKIISKSAISSLPMIPR